MVEGNYWAELIEAKTTKSSKGTPSIEITWSIVKRDSGGAWEDIAPITRTTYWYLSAAARESTHAKLKAVEFNGEFASPQFGVEGAQLTLAHELYNGREQERWELSDWGGGSRNEIADTDTIRELNTHWKNEVGTAVGSPPPPKPQPPSSGPLTGDAIPY